MQELQFAGSRKSDRDPPGPIAEGQCLQEHRIRLALGVTRGPLPPITRQSLRLYYSYLLDHLAFPFEGQYAEEHPFQRAMVAPVTVVGLVELDETPDLENSGILSRAVRGQQELCVPLSDVDLGEGTPNFQLLEDYWYWLWNSRFDPSI
jgi:hypothetical protein